MLSKGIDISGKRINYLKCAEKVLLFVLRK